MSNDEDLVALGDVLGNIQETKTALIDYDDEHAKAYEQADNNATNNERALLGGLILGGIDVCDDIEGVGLSESDFQRTEHSHLFSAIQRLHVKRRPIDALTVVDELNRVAKLQEIGGASFVSSLESLIPTTAHCASYAKMILNSSRRRTLARLGRTIVRRSERGVHWQEVADFSESELMSLQKQRTGGELVDLHDTVKSALSNLPGMGGVIQGELTGFADLDNVMRLRRGELIIVAARPSMGKTAFALDVFRDMTVRQQKPCAFFSLEMDGESLITREIAADARVPSRKRSLTPADVGSLTQSAGDIAISPQFIDETPGISIGEIRSRARALHRKHGLAAVFVDYLSLIKAPNEMAQKNQQVADVSLGLKNLARELKIPVVCLSQLNRGVESRPNKRPMMSDLRDSGAVEQDADIILFIYRDEYYYGTKSDKPGIAEIIIGKHRNGPTETIELHFNPNLPRFDNLSRTP